MNPMIPLFVAVPLAGAFLIMILGRLNMHFCKYFASLVLLFLVVISFR
jgi:NADH:ubiquinone oxidoreductase subunit 4 (subunit M)